MIRRRLAQVAETCAGVVMEDKGYSAALHYRRVPQKESRVLDAVTKACAEFPFSNIEILRGSCVVEVKGPDVSKGHAVRELMTHSPFAHRRPIFIGDDVTDESVFKIIPDFDGLAFSVGRQWPGTSGHFDRPEDVRRWLEQIARQQVDSST